MPTTAADLERAFLGDIQDHPADPVPKLIYADWLTERGEEPLSFAFRWAAKHGRHPFVSPQGRRVWWSTTWRGQNPKKPPCAQQLPRLILSLMRGVKPPRARGAPPQCPCRSLRDAFLKLAGALSRLRDLLAC